MHVIITCGHAVGSQALEAGRLTPCVDAYAYILRSISEGLVAVWGRFVIHMQCPSVI